MLRAVLIAIALLVPSLSAAQSGVICNGPSFVDQLSMTQRAELEQIAADTPFGSGNFWLATKGDTTLTIIGTMHLPDPRHNASLVKVLPRLAQSDLLLVEATLEDQAEMQLHLSRNPDLMTLQDTTLPELMDEATWEALREAASARGLPSFMAAKMQPWFLSLTLAIPPCAMPVMATGQAGIDNDLMRRAQVMNVPFAPLEPWQDMLDLLSSGTLEEQIDALRVGLIAPEIQDAMIVALTDFYFDGNSAMSWHLAYYVKDYLPPETALIFDAQMEELTTALLNDRNANWIPVIEDAAQNHDDIFVGFGAAHLFGEQGVLQLLENNGWVISRF